MASDHVEVELARPPGKTDAPVRREPGVTLVVRSPGPRGDNQLIITGDELRVAVRPIERQAAHRGGIGDEAERLRAALGAAADRLLQAAARFERLGLDAAAATVRVVERDARDTLRELRAGREEGREDGAR